MDKRIYINAAIAYLFLGFLFLLAKANPMYSDSYIQFHAKRATKLHLIFFFSYLIYSNIVVPLYIYLPYFADLIKLLGDIVFFVGFLSYILYSAYRAFLGKAFFKEENIPSQTFSQSFLFGIQSFSLGNTGEKEKALLLLSSIPFFGFFLEKKHRHPLVSLGSYLGTFGATLFSLGYVFFGQNAIWVLVIYLAFWVLQAVQVIVNNRLILPPQALKNSSVDNLSIIFRATLCYLLGLSSLIKNKEYISLNQYQAFLSQQYVNDKRKVNTKEISDFLQIIATIPIVNFSTYFFYQKYGERKYILLQEFFLSLLYIGNAWFFTWCGGFFYLLVLASLYLFSRMQSFSEVKVFFVHEALTFILLGYKKLKIWTSYLKKQKNTIKNESFRVENK